jgi:nitrate reductase gamma subunit
MDNFDLLLYGIYPYIAMFVFLIFTINRYLGKGYSYSSLSSQFLENRIHFWALVPFHFGIIFIFVGHLAAFLIPSTILAWNSDLTRLYILEVSAFIGGLATLVGMFFIFVRRIFNAKANMVTSTMDWVILTLILLQVIAGLGTAIFHSWGSSWFAAVATPYLLSIFSFSPNIDFITPLPWIVKLHIFGAWSIILLFPFSRLVHVLVMPNPYLWRKPQLVRWYWNRKKRFIQ